MIMQKHIARMTLREKCAQMVFIGFRFDDPDYERTMRWVRREGVGGVCLSGGSIFDVTPLVNSLQRVAPHPLLVASDFENGAAQQVSGATVFPSNMAVGASGSEDLAQLKGRHTGREARTLGVPWVLAPVVDVNLDPLHPVINTRSFGQDPAQVGKLGRAYLRGLHAAGVLGCAKHFPGHGPAAADPHLELPTLEPSLERLKETDLVPFAEMAPEVDAVMTGHLRVPALDPDAPASLSRAVTEDLLRRQLGFEGLIVTDMLTMGGVSRFCPAPEAAERAAAAGADVLLCPQDPDGAIRALEEAVKAGRLAEEAVDRAAERILGVKEKLGLYRERLTDVRSVEGMVKNEAHRAGAQKIAEAAVTLVRGTGRVEGAADFLLVRDPGARGDFSVFEKELSRKVRIQDGDGACVVAVFFRPRPATGRARLDESLVERVREAGRRCRETVVVSFGSPYVIRDFPDVAGYVCAYGEDEHSQRAAARALLGEIPYRGNLPVTLGV